MCDIPQAIADAETIVRALRECHIRKGKLRENVFRSPAGIDEVSVMRHTHMGSVPCKSKAKEIAAGDPNNRYVGFAAIAVRTVRSLSSEVHDSREEFCGHAHISHGMVVPADEPPDTALVLRWQEMKSKAILLLDPQPDVEDWAGPEIELPQEPAA